MAVNSRTNVTKFCTHSIDGINEILDKKPKSLEVSALIKRIYNAQKSLNQYKRDNPFEDCFTQVSDLQKQIHRLQKKILKLFREDLNSNDSTKLNSIVKQVSEQEFSQKNGSFLPGVIPPIFLSKDPVVLKGMSRFAHQHLLQCLIHALDQKKLQEAQTIYKMLSLKDKSYLPILKQLQKPLTDESKEWVEMSLAVGKHLKQLESTKESRMPSEFLFYNQCLKQSMYDIFVSSKEVFGEETLMVQIGAVFRDDYATTEISDIKEKGRQIILQELTHPSVGRAITQLRQGIIAADVFKYRIEKNNELYENYDEEMDGSYEAKDEYTRDIKAPIKPKKFYSLTSLLPTGAPSKTYLENMDLASQTMSAVMKQITYSTNYPIREDTAFDVEEAEGFINFTLTEQEKWRLQQQKSFSKECPQLASVIDSSFFKKISFAKGARKIGVGNCDELASILFYHLTSLRIPNKRIELFQFTDKTGDHVFVVIDRAEGSSENDPSSWGEDAVCVDVWARTHFPGVAAIKYLKNYLQKMSDQQQPCLETYDPKKHELISVCTNFYSVSFLKNATSLPQEIKDNFIEEYREFLEEKNLDKRFSCAKTLLSHSMFQEKNLKNIPLIREIFGQLRFFVMGKIVQRVEKRGDFYSIVIDDENF